MTRSTDFRACALGIVGAFALTAATAHETVTPAAPTATAGVSEAQALRVMRDKATGKLRAPTAEEAKAMDAAERAARKARGEPEVAAAQPLVLTRHANGMQSAVLGTEFMVTLRATRRADGSLDVKHDDPAHEHPQSSGNATQLPTK